MSIEVLISIVGAFGVVALGINAFFLKGIYSELNDVKLQMVKVITSSDYLKFDLLALEKEHNELASTVQSMLLDIERLKK